jgi:hypothetical protein
MTPTTIQLQVGNRYITRDESETVEILGVGDLFAFAPFVGSDGCHYHANGVLDAWGEETEFDLVKEA